MSTSEEQKTPTDEISATENTSENIQNSFMTSEQLKEAKHYNRLSLTCSLMDRAVDLLYLTVFTFFCAIPVDGWLKDLTFTPIFQNIYVRAACLLLFMTAGHILISLPLSFYDGYVLEKKFGLSNLSMRKWVKRFFAKMILATILNLFLLLTVFFLMHSCGTLWWIVAALAFFCFSMLLGVLLPVTILPLFYKIERLDNPELLTYLERCTYGTSLTLEGVYQMALSEETTKANAMLAGMGKSRRVILGDTLLKNFTWQEIEAIFAHEVGHHVHRHLPKMLFCGLLGSFIIFFVIDIFIRFFFYFMEPSTSGTGAFSFFNASFPYADLPEWILPAFLLGITITSTFLEPLQNALSRYFENQSDEYAVKNTSADAMIQAFRKLAIQNKADPDPHWLEVWWMHSHPALAERIRRCEKLKAERINPGDGEV
ncbi:MAG: M48 family metallopeptidase [Planctomycetia bacterium]|nr:M48 family metallopeptidase [Planctomycetia bacterium]